MRRVPDFLVEVSEESAVLSCIMDRTVVTKSVLLYSVSWEWVNPSLILFYVFKFKSFL